MRRPSSFNLFLGGVIAIGVTIAVVALIVEGPRGLLGPRPGLFGIFASLLLLAESRPVIWLRRRQGAVITAAPSFNAALLFLTPGLGAAVASGLLSAIGDISCGRPPIKTAFNAAMMTITMSATSMVLLVSGERLTLLGDGSVTVLWMVVAGLALVVYNVVNDLQVSTVIALSERLPVLAAIRKDIIRNLQTDGVLLALGPVMVVVAVRSMLLMPVLLVVIIIVLNTTRMALERLHQATHDPLTGLPNRRLFDEHLAQLLGDGKAFRPAVVLAIDLDRFKEINDTLGHDVGDRVLVAVAERLQAAVPASGMVARLGGDEFAVVLTDSLATNSPRDVSAAIHRAFTGSLEAEGLPLTVGGSVGIAVRDADSSVTQLMRRADLAMYQAKSEGGGVRLHQEGGEASVRTGRLALLDQIGPAIEDGELRLHYQPIVDAAARRVTGVEALVRWQHPELGMVPPGEFIPTVEQTDLIEPLTAWVLERALADCRLFHELGHDIDVTVNLSSRSITDLGFPRRLRQILAASGLAPHRLTLELTENTILGDTARALQVLTEIRAVGVRLALDDFGTGYSSLSNLRQLPLDVVKVDRTFVTHMLEVPEDAAIVSMVLRLAHRLGLATVAEGIEDEDVAAHLVSEGCTHLQGFHIARPMPFEAIADWMSGHEVPPGTAGPGRAARAEAIHKLSPAVTP